MTVSTNRDLQSSSPRFWCICITRCTSDIIREMRNKGAVHRLNKASAVRHTNQLCLACVSASSQFNQSRKKLYESKSIKAFSFKQPWIKIPKYEREVKEKKAVIRSKDCCDIGINGRMLIQLFVSGSAEGCIRAATEKHLCHCDNK